MTTTPRGVPSPCNSVCRMHAPTGWCEGCLRTLDEIAAWATLGDDGKHAVWQQLPLRRERLQVLQQATSTSPR